MNADDRIGPVLLFAVLCGTRAVRVKPPDTMRLGRIALSRRPSPRAQLILHIISGSPPLASATADASYSSCCHGHASEVGWCHVERLWFSQIGRTSLRAFSLSGYNPTVSRTLANFRRASRPRCLYVGSRRCDSIQQSRQGLSPTSAPFGRGRPHSLRRRLGMARHWLYTAGARRLYVF